MIVDIIAAPGTDAGTLRELALRAERYGIRGLWAASFPAHRDPFMTLVPAALATQRIRLGVLPMSPFEKHPVRIADTLLTLHDLSRGRAALLVGALGKSGMQAMRLEPVQRVSAVADCVRILRGAAARTRFDYAGTVFSAGGYAAPWAPESPPAVYVAANGPQMLRMAGREADGVMLSDATEPLLPGMLAMIDAGLEVGGRGRAGFPVSNFWAWHIQRDRTASVREARRELVWRGALLRSHIGPFLDPEDVAFVERHWDRFYRAFLARSDVIEGVPDRIVEALLEALTFTGDATDVPRAASRLRALEAAGLTEVALRLFDAPLEGVELIGERLLPALAREHPAGR
jgi:5,10-methylenetetrahydromethanopterin reductase